MVWAPEERMAEELWRYGEDETAAWIRDCSEDELVRVSSVAGWLVLHGPRVTPGSMPFAKACALAAVYVREGAPRELARRRRRPAEPQIRAREQRLARGRGRPLTALTEVPREYGVGDDARRYWGSSAGE